MMGRDDVAVGVGGDGGISDDGEIQPDVGGYFPLIDQVTIAYSKKMHRRRPRAAAPD
jgi:hypothetical protein